MNIQSMQQPSFSGIFTVNRAKTDITGLVKQVKKQIPNANVSFKYSNKDIFLVGYDPGKDLKAFQVIVSPEQDIKTMKLLKQTSKAPEKLIGCIIDYTNGFDCSM